MNELSAAIDAIRKAVPKAVEKAVLESVVSIADNAPKFSGQLRASINVGFNDPDMDVVLAPVYERNAIANPEQKSKARARKAMKGYRLGDMIYISNNLPYAAVQEYEAGHLMFTIAANLFATKLERNFNAS